MGPFDLVRGVGVEVRELALVALLAMPLHKGTAYKLLSLPFVQLCCCGWCFITAFGRRGGFAFPPALILSFSSFALGLATVTVAALSSTVLQETLKRVRPKHNGELGTANVAESALFLTLLRGQLTLSKRKSLAEFKTLEELG
jgi:hypothetical protein